MFDDDDLIEYLILDETMNETPKGGKSFFWTLIRLLFDGAVLVVLFRWMFM